MAETRYHRVSALADVALQGRFGADKGAPGVTFSVRHPVSIALIIARKGKSGVVSAAMQAAFRVSCPEPGYSAQGAGVTLHWCAPGQWYAVADGMAEGALYKQVRDGLRGVASVTDQSHGRIIIGIAGPKARATLAKGTPVDLHSSAFGSGRSAVTTMAHTGVHLAQVGPDAFELSVYRAFSESFWGWLTEQAEEFGYQVT
ncbi:sarcosine oxidase subunit gamma [soil metagenome]